MIIGCPKEMKSGETRVAMTPKWTGILVKDGHRVLIQSSAGEGSGFSDADYRAAGAEIIPTIEGLYGASEFVVKAKEIQQSEYNLLKKDQMVMAWFHLAEDFNNEMTNALLRAQAIGLSMELIITNDGFRPTIKPMSDIAGSLATLEAARLCQKQNGGSGILLRKVYGLRTPKIVVLGGGNAGLNAAQVGLALGVDVTVIESSWNRIDALKSIIPNAEIVYGDPVVINELLAECDVFINCIYPTPYQKDPLVCREQVQKMKEGSVIVDIAGAGIIETSHYTTLSEPTFYEEGILHYCVDNMPAMCPKTSTEALLMITGPYIQAIANKGLKKAVMDDNSLFRCVSTLKGEIVHDEMGIKQNLPYKKFNVAMLDS